MKKVLLFVLLSLYTILGFSQLKITKSNKETIGRIDTGGQLAIECIKENENIILNFRNLHELEYVEISSFELDNDSFNMLHTLIMDNIKKTPLDDIQLELNDSYIWLRFDNTIGIKTAKIIYSKTKNIEKNNASYSIKLNKKMAKELFNI